MRFETNEIVIELIERFDGGEAVLIYPNPIRRNARAVWKGGAPSDCVKAGRGLRIDFTFTEPPQLEQRQLAASLPDDDKAGLVARFLEAQAAYLSGDIKLEAI